MHVLHAGFGGALVSREELARLEAVLRRFPFQQGVTAHALLCMQALAGRW